MSFIETQKYEGIGTLRLARGKVNAINGEVVHQLSEALETFKNDSAVKAVILTGKGDFFSFGFDVPEFLSYSQESFFDFMKSFTGLYTDMFLYRKPIIAAINGHAMAGGCMLALACDVRIMVSGNAKISLNEIEFGSSVPAGSVEMLRFCVGNKNAMAILYGGALYSAEEAGHIGLVDEIASDGKLFEQASYRAKFFGQKSADAFNATKMLIRNPIAEIMKVNEQESIKRFVEIWYSDSTWQKIKQIRIR